MRTRLLACVSLLGLTLCAVAQDQPKGAKKADAKAAAQTAAKAPAKDDKPQLPPEVQAKIVALVQGALSRTGVPSASVGILKDGKVVFAQAFGTARLEKAVAADAAMAYPVGSISKQFTAAAVMLLVEDEELTLDDKVSVYFPELTRAGEVTVRELLSHTSGYEDDAPLDYIPPALYKAIAPIEVAHRFAGKALDFDPGTKWQYSNTGFVVAALIVEKVSGEPLGKFLTERVFTPLGMTDAVNTYAEREKLKVTGYQSDGLAPPRELPLEAPGWYYGDGDLAMSAGSLLKWDESLIEQKLLKPASYAAMETSVKLADASDTHYGLGLFVQTRNGRRRLEHGGEVGGFVAENVVYPDDRVAVVVLTNEVASSAATAIADGILPLLLGGDQNFKEMTDPMDSTVRKVLTGLQLGAIDRSLLTADASAYFSTEVLNDFKIGMGRMGAIVELEHGPERLRGGFRIVGYKAKFADGTVVSMPLFFTPDGKIEQFLVIKP